MWAGPTVPAIVSRLRAHSCGASRPRIVLGARQDDEARAAGANAITEHATEW
jgi:hypothetical protein